jgi:xanthine dehydrogenase accessory factor
VSEVDVWSALLDDLAAGTRCAILAVADSRGSSPGRAGAVMAVGPDGPIAGTIGGGAAESDLVDRVVADLAADDARGQVIDLEHRRGAANSSGMICGGSQRVVVTPVQPGDAPGVRQVRDALRAGRQIDWTVDAGGWRAIGDGGGPAWGLVDDGRAWGYRHRSGPSHSVHIVGAGHVGSALARLLVGLDFRVVAIDERAALDLAGVAAHERLRLAYADLARAVTPGAGSYAVVMTHSHERDAVALEALLGLRLGYLGLLGSRAKVRQLTAGRDLPGWFRAPIGLPIGSTTPAEIAVSVAAELVAERAGVGGQGRAGRRQP